MRFRIPETGEAEEAGQVPDLQRRIDLGAAFFVWLDVRADPDRPRLSHLPLHGEAKLPEQPDRPEIGHEVLRHPGGCEGGTFLAHGEIERKLVREIGIEGRPRFTVHRKRSGGLLPDRFRPLPPFPEGGKSGNTALRLDAEEQERPLPRRLYGENLDVDGKSASRSRDRSTSIAASRWRRAIESGRFPEADHPVTAWIFPLSGRQSGRISSEGKISERISPPPLG